MENYSYNSYPESGGSTPRSREIDFDNPQPWDDHSTGSNNNYKVKLMCSYGGKIHPRTHDNQLAYIGGDTKILSVDRSIKLSALLAKLSTVCDADVSFKYQLPGEDLDALISVTDDDDMDHMMNEYDRLNKASLKPARLRLFLFPVTVHVQTPAVSSVHSFGSTEGRSERERFVDALNSGQMTQIQSANPPSHGNADFLFGSEKGVAPASVPVLNVPNVRDLPITYPAIRHHDPDVIGADRIQKHIQDLRIADQQQNPYTNTRQSDDNLGYAGDYYVQRAPEKVVTNSNTPPGNVVPVPSPAPEYQISGGFRQSIVPPVQQPVYMSHPPESMYHAPIATPVTASAGHGQSQSQGFYTVRRMPNEYYREQSVVQPVQSTAAQPVFHQQPPPQKTATNSDGIRMVQTVQSTAGMTEAAYAQVAYDNGVARYVYYTAQGALVTPHQQLSAQVQQPPLQPITHQYQAVGPALNEDGSK